MVEWKGTSAPLAPAWLIERLPALTSTRANIKRVFVFMIVLARFPGMEFEFSPRGD
jgi:hypothetical protein